MLCIFEYFFFNFCRYYYGIFASFLNALRARKSMSNLIWKYCMGFGTLLQPTNEKCTTKECLRKLVGE